MSRLIRDEDRLIDALQRNWRAEMEGAATYRWLAGQAEEPRKKEILDQLARGEERHAARWAARLRELGAGPPPGPLPAVPASIRIKARAGLDNALHALEANEEAHVRQYQAQIRADDAETAAILRELARDEQQHAGMLGQLAGAPLGPKSQLDALMKGEKHITSGSWLGDAIYGANDGLAAVFGLIAGVSGAAVSSHVILLAGIAGAVASAVSMGAGAYLASKSEREVFDAQLAHERQEIVEHPDEEREELSLFYQLKGMTPDEADRAVGRIAENPDLFLDALAHEELGLREEAMPNPWTSAFSATLSTAIGAAIPVIPFVFLTGGTAIIVAFIVSLIGHFVVGALKSLLTIRPWWSSGLEMTLIGVLVGGIT
ncbi:MAG TPA: VIT1/CCC1 transporter family protein, partial [Chloroflexota bacterium]|nr:VIT1/CCC1 transporter family protein [Chloroflexota bacterium]